MSDNTQAKPRKVELGALWKKTSQKTGTKFFTGFLYDAKGVQTPVIAFINKEDMKKNSQEPDLRIYLSDQSPNQTTQNTNVSKPATKAVSKPAPKVAVEAESTDDPFA